MTSVGAARAQHDWASTLGPTLKTASGDKPIEEVLKGKKQVALFFAGSWCPWCRALTPKLETTIRNVMGADPNDTAVVYISSDADKDAFEESRKGKPWSA